MMAGEAVAIADLQLQLAWLFAYANGAVFADGLER